MKYIKNILPIIITIFVVLISHSCANRGAGPQGGPKDTIPPAVVKSFPLNKSLNVSKSKIQIIFDENIVVQKVSEKVIISPPQKQAPNIQALGKTLTVELNDSLLSNTTYSINFGNAIVDNNENNPLKNYVFAFSTGNSIDTLQISGTVINAENLNPMAGITVGIYEDFTDSAFFKKPFLRITKTDDKGRFTVPNIKYGKYVVRALKDDSRDNIFQSGEGLAFNDSVFAPSVTSYMRQDTIWKDSVKIDTIKSVKAFRYLPENVLLRFFKESNSKKQRFIKSERKDKNHFTLFFNAPAKELPNLELLNASWTNDKYLLQKNATLDTLTYWLTDKELIKKDTLLFKMKYLKTDSTNHLSYSTDTLKINFRRGGGNKLPPSKPSDKAEAKRELLNISTNLSGTFDVYNPITFNFDIPIKLVDSTKIHLSQMRDTIPVPLKFNIKKQDAIGLKFAIAYPWKPEEKYVLNIDSAAFYNIYDINSGKYKGDFKIKSLDEYSSMKLLLEKYDSTAVFQVLSTNDEVVKTIPAVKNGARVGFLQPGDYYIRIFIDRNGNGKWDTGNYLQKLQPEEVYYYPKKLKLIKNWEIEETIDYKKLPLLKSKPKELIKETQKNDNTNN